MAVIVNAVNQFFKTCCDWIVNSHFQYCFSMKQTKDHSLFSSFTFVLE